jgi:ribosomal protein S18 acetylase RimI-like enzyme
MTAQDCWRVRKAREIGAADLRAIKVLQTTCNRHEGLDLALNLDPPGPGEPDAANQFLCEAGDDLLGVLTLFGEGDGIEVCAAVRPDYRRRGIGTALVNAARAECRRRGIRHWLLVCEDGSRSGKAFAAAQGARYRSAEYRMRLELCAAPGSAPPVSSSLEFVRAGPSDLELLTGVIVASFDRAEGVVRKQVADNLATSRRRYYLARLDGAPVGSVGIVEEGSRVHIVGFGVLPQHRRRGIGRRMLQYVVAMLVAEGWRDILMEVATDSQPAVSLYRSCGFKEVRTYGFYAAGL